MAIGEGRLVRFLRVCGIGAFALLLAISLSTCGIQSTESVFPSPAFSSPNNFAVTLTSIPASNLFGYYVYYRVFDDQATADKARQAIENFDGQTTTQTPANCVANLQTALFVRICDETGYDNASSPLFSVPTGSSSFVYNIYLDAGSGPTTTYTGSSYNWYYTRSDALATQIPITRNLYQNGVQPTTPKSFEEVYNVGDPDYAGAGTQVGSQVYFVFFAVAYGVDMTSGNYTSIYSFPASLYVSLPYTINYQ